MYNSLFKITEIQSNCQKIIQDFQNHIRYIKKFTQKYQLENVLEEEVEEITTEFMKYIKENYLKSCPINREEKKTFEEASFKNQVWRDFMEQQLVKYNNLEGQKDKERLQYKLSKNKDLEVTLKLMDLQGIINEMEEWRPEDEDIQNINKTFKQLMRNIKVKEQSNDDDRVPNPFYSSLYSPLLDAAKKTNMLQTSIRQTNDRLHKYRIVINEDEKSKSVIDINEYLRGRGIGSISEFLNKRKDFFGNQIETPCLGNDGEIYDLKSMEYLFDKEDNGKFKNIKYIVKNGESTPDYPKMSNDIALSSFTVMYQQDKEPSYENKDIVSTRDLKDFYNAWHSQFLYNTKMKKLLNQKQFQNKFKAKIKEFDESITFSQSITDKNMDRSDLEEATKQSITSFLENLFRFYYFLYKFLSDEYGIEFIPNFRIENTTFSKKETSFLLLKQKYLDRIVEIYNKLEADYQEKVWNVLHPPPKTTTLQKLKGTFGLKGGKPNTETGK